MRTLSLAAVLALLSGAAVAQQQTFYNERGQISGSSSTSGNVTTFRDRSADDRHHRADARLKASLLKIAKILLN